MPRARRTRKIMLQIAFAKIFVLPGSLAVGIIVNGPTSVSRFQLVQAKLADMAVKVSAARLLVFQSAYLRDNGKDRVTKESAMAKLYATEIAQEVIDQAVQIHGGYGVCKGFLVEKLYREIRAMRIYEGTSEIQQIVIANQLFKE